METMDASISETMDVEMGKNPGNTVLVESFKSRVDDIFTKVDKVIILAKYKPFSVPVS